MQACYSMFQRLQRIYRYGLYENIIHLPAIPFLLYRLNDMERDIYICIIHATKTSVLKPYG